jgi:formylglycine-generating enzyme required for sulfatase activity
MKYALCIALCISAFLTAFAEDRKAGDRMTIRVKDTEFAFRWCPPGTFRMGSDIAEQNEAVRQAEIWADRKLVNERAKREYKALRRSYIQGEVLHNVQLTKGFWMQETEVTQEQWNVVEGNLDERLMPTNFKNPQFPVVAVSFDNCVQFVRHLNQIGGVLPAELRERWRFALPSEAQWEYACRAGTQTAFSCGNVLNGDKANCDGRFPFGTHKLGVNLMCITKAGTYAANDWGLFDMHGNVWEWCSDWFGPYPKGFTVDPKGPESGTTRVYRGGSWQNRAGSCRAAYRANNIVPQSEFIRMGVRLAITE